MNKETLTRRFAEAREALVYLSSELRVHGESYVCRKVEQMRADIWEIEREIRRAAEAGDEL
jgi:threonine aldolase